MADRYSQYVSLLARMPKVYLEIGGAAPVSISHRHFSGLPALSPSIGVIPLTQGYVAFVDMVDYLQVTQYRWHVIVGRGLVYVCHSKWGSSSIKLHRMITHAKAGEVVHHRNEVGVDNRRYNCEVMSQRTHMYLHWDKYTGKCDDYSDAEMFPSQKDIDVEVDQSRESIMRHIRLERQL